MNVGTPQPANMPGILTLLTRYVLSFAVFFVVGLAPFLGEADVPGFKALLTLIPENLRNTAIPISAFVMGVTAVVLQRYAYGNPSLAWVELQFSRSWKLALGAALALVVIYTFTVVPFPVPAQGGYTTYVQVGFYRPHNSYTDHVCPPEIGDIECLSRVTLDRAKIESFWGDTNVRWAALALQFAYWSATGILVWVIGLLILRQRTTRSRARP